MDPKDEQLKVNHGEHRGVLKLFNVRLKYDSFFDAAGMLLWFAMTFYIAEILRRFCLFTEEINHINTRYEGSISRLILHVFGSRPSANFGALLIILSLGFVSNFFN